MTGQCLEGWLQEDNTYKGREKREGPKERVGGRLEPIVHLQQKEVKFGKRSTRRDDIELASHIL